MRIKDKRLRLSTIPFTSLEIGEVFEAEAIKHCNDGSDILTTNLMIKTDKNSYFDFTKKELVLISFEDFKILHVNPVEIEINIIKNISAYENLDK